MKKLLLLLFVVPMFCFGQIPDSKQNTFVNDYYGILTDAQIKELNDSILSIEKKSPTQIAILLLKEIPNGIEPAEYANNVGRQWHVGKDKSGIVYVAGIDQRKQGIGTALNIEASITDYECSRIMDEMKPYFRQKDYYGGLKHMVAEINKLVDPSAPTQSSSSNTWIFILLGVTAAGILVYFIFRRKRVDGDSVPYSYHDYDSSSHLGSFATGYVAGSYESSSPSSYNDSSSSSSSSSSSNSSSSSSYGSYDSGSSGDSGFSGGGASSDW